MGSTTNIEWTDATWNPIRGCSRVSEGCRNCYAEKVAYRFSGAGRPYEGLATKVNGHASWTGKVTLAEKHLLDPLKWGPVKAHSSLCERYAEARDQLDLQCKCGTRPRRIFVNSMSDLFHENVPDEWIDRIFAMMALCPQHQFQVLTKRPERMLKYLTGLCCGRISDEVAELVEKHWHRDWIKGMPRGFEWNVYGKIRTSGGVGDYWPLPNVWLGVSVENQAAADERIPLLLDTPAAVRFISAEPLLGSVNLNRIEVTDGEVDRSDPENPCVSGYCIDAMSGEAFDDENGSLSTAPDGEVPLERGLDWVIVGGESGAGARPMHPDWARSLRDQCQAAGVPFFFKQWGEWLPWNQVAGLPDVGEPALRYSAHGLVYADGNTSLHSGPDKPDPEMGLWTHDLDGNDGAAAVYRVGKKAAGALLDGREWREFPEVSA